MPDYVLSEKDKRAVTIIVELVEDEHFPARRNITDYVLELITPYERMKAMDIFINNLYRQYDIKKGGQ